MEEKHIKYLQKFTRTPELDVLKFYARSKDGKPLIFKEIIKSRHFPNSKYKRRVLKAETEREIRARLKKAHKETGGSFTQNLKDFANHIVQYWMNHVMKNI